MRNIKMKFILFVGLLFGGLMATAQTGVFNQIQVNNNLRLKGYTISGISNDSALAGKDSANVVTEWAVYNYLKNHSANVDSTKFATVYQNSLKVNVADTAAMLSPYARNQRMIDSLNLVQNRLNLKLNVADTAAMLLPYAKTSTVNNSIATKLNVSDTAAMLSPYAKASIVNSSIATKLNVSDTAAMLSPYAKTSTVNNSIATKLNVSDTAAMLSPYAKTSTVNNSIATKLNVSDTAAMLSHYVPTSFKQPLYVDKPLRVRGDTAIYIDSTLVTLNGVISVNTTLDNNFLLVHYANKTDSFRINEDTSFIPPLRALIKAKADTAVVVFANGKSGGQTIAGGKNAGENLTLTSNINSSLANKGKVFLGSAGTDFYDEKNDSLKIGPMSFWDGNISNYILGAPQRVAFPTGIQVFDNVEIAAGAAYAFLSPNHGTQYWSYLSLGSNDNLYFHLNTSVPMIMGQNGVSFSGNDPSPVKDATAKVQISSSDGTAGNGPLKLGAGALVSTPENGLIEYDNKDFFVTNSLTRYRVVKVTVGSTLSINPFTVGEVYDDTTNKKVYISTGINSPEGWKEIDGTGTGGGATINDAAPSLTQVYSSSKTTALNVAKADTSSVTQTADYIIEKVGSTIYARPAFKSGLPLYSGTDAFTVIQSAITQLRDSGFIFIKKGLYYLTDELTITGLGSGFHTLTIKGTGLASILYGYTTGKNGLVIKNRAGVDIEDLKIQMESQCKSALFLDSSGTSEVSVMESKFNHLQLISGNSAYPALLAENVWFTDFSNLYVVNTGGDGIWFKNASRSNVNYGNSTVSKLDVVSGTGTGYAGIRFLGAWNTRGVYDQIKISSYYDYAESGTPADYGIYATSVGDVSFSDIDLENLYHPIYLGDQGGTVQGFRVIGGAIVTAGDTIITVKGTLSGGNIFQNLGMAGGSSSTLTVYDQCTSYAPNTYYNLWLHSTLDPTKLSIAWSSATSLKLRTSTGTQEYLPNPTMPTRSPKDSSKAGATTAYVDNAVSAGKYTPTITPIVGVDSFTLVTATYRKTGNIVHISMTITISVSNPASTPLLTFTLPTGLSTTYITGNGSGVAAGTNGHLATAYINDTTHGDISFFTATSDTYYLQFDYSLN